jgi:glycosyltransferase involved in cell wall biosynthesis
MNTLILLTENLSKDFLMKSLTFLNFKKEKIHVLNSSKILFLEELGIDYIEIKDSNEFSINYNMYAFIICDYDNYIDIKNYYNNYIIFNYNIKLINNLNDYKSTNICLDETSDILLHLYNNILFNVDDNKYYFLKNNTLYLTENNTTNEDILYINNKYIDKINKINKIETTNKKYELAGINSKIVEFDNFPYKIVEYNNKYYKKYNNKIQEISIDNLKKNLNNIIDSIDINNENISHCEVVDNLELHFTILILSHNNEKYTDLCLKSALNQNYKNFNVLFINCNSTDLTRTICDKYSDKYDNFTIIDEIDRIYQTENFLLGTLLCEKNTTIVSLDGDDWLSTCDVLKTLNNVYFSTRCLMTYGSYIEFPYRNVKWGWKHRTLHELINIRKNKFSLSHLRTWNKELFLNINQESLKINNKYPEMTGDVSVLLYMVEMFPEKCIFINKILYVYNRTNVLSDSIINEKKQIETAEYFFNLDKYSRIEIESILRLNDPLLYFINELQISNLKFSMINKYLNYRKHKFICNHSYKIFKNTDYQTQCHTGFHRFDFNKEESDQLNLFLTTIKLENYKLLKGNNLYKKYCSIKNKNKLGIIILSCKKRLHKAIQKLNQFKESNINAICKIFVGDVNIEKSYEKNNIVYLNIPDNYESLPLKVYRSMSWFLDNHNIDYIFKTDDDIVIDFNKLSELFENNISNKILYCGNVAVFKPFYDTNHFDKTEDKKFNNEKGFINYYGFYCSGGGYFVHTTILKNCLEKYINLYFSKKILAEDLLMGIVVNELNILPIHIDYFNKKILDWGEPESSSYYFWHWRNLFEQPYPSGNL